MSESNSGLGWSEPPTERKMYNWPKIAARLEARPNEWLLIFRQDRASVVHAIRRGAIAAVKPELGFEAETRKNVRGTPRTCDLYMRYVPPKPKRKRKR